MYILCYCCGSWLVLLNISKLIICIWVRRHFKQENPAKIQNEPTLFGIKNQ